MSAGQIDAGTGFAGLAPAGITASALQFIPSAMRLDGKTKDWVLNDSGQYEAVHWVDQCVAMSLLIKKGDIAGDVRIGNALHQVRASSRSLASDIRRACVESFPISDLLAERSIAVISVDHELRSGGGFVVGFTYHNLLFAQSSKGFFEVLTGG